MTTRILLAALSLATLTFANVGCQTVREAYYNGSEWAFNYTKRERLVNRVETARNEQDAAKKQFASALEEFKSVVNFNGGDLEAMYNKLNAAYKASESKAAGVKSRIQDVKNVGVALFKEWDGEINQMQDASLKASNANLRDKTKSGYDQLLAKMDTAATTMDPVLQKFKDRVLFVKGNLNAQAIGSLKGTEVSLGNDIDALIKEMEASIKEADDFIAANKAK
ncbi:MAG: DUF2959 family protein [Tepidisphaeraceae bacterium]